MPFNQTTEREDKKLQTYSRVGLFFLGVYTLGIFAIVLQVFPTHPRLASLLLSLWGIAALFPATVFLSVGLVASSQMLDKGIHKIINLIRNYGLFVSLIVSFLAIISTILFVFYANTFYYDEEAYLFQAKTYLLGRVVMPVPVVPESIGKPGMIMNWIWTTQYLWGHPVLLSVGMLVGSPYVSTVLMAIGSLVLLYVIGIRTASKEEATLAVILMGTSPWFWFVSGTFLSHISMLFLLLVFVYGWLRLQDRPGLLLGTALGLCLGWAFTVRPLTAICFAVPFGLVAVTKVWHEPRRWLFTVAGLLSGWIAIIVMVMFYNTLVTGDPLTFPLLYYTNAARLGFGERASGTFTPFTALLNLAKNVFLVNMWLFGWPISLLPSITFVTGRLINKLPKKSGKINWLGISNNWNSWDTIWIALIFSIAGGYFFYYWGGATLTIPRFYYELLIPLCLLSAKGLMNVHRLFSDMNHRWRLLVPVFCIASFLCSIIFFVPVRAAHLRKRCDPITIRVQIELADELRERKALIFVECEQPNSLQFFTLPWPSPKLDDQMLFVFLRDDATNESAIRAFPDRIPYLMECCDRQFRQNSVKRLPIVELSNVPDIKKAERTTCSRGKIDLVQPPPATVYLLKLLGLYQDPRN